MRKKLPSQSPKPNELKLLPAVVSPLGKRSLQSYSDYVDLAQDLINGVLSEEIDTKKAHCVAILIGYGTNALREARGGKLMMTTFLQDMRKVKVEMLSNEDMDAFLQGNEETQIEVLKRLEDKGGVVTAEVTVNPKRAPKAKLDTELLSNMAGITAEEVKDALSGEPIEVEMVRRSHKWELNIGGTVRFCMNCGMEKDVEEAVDGHSACSGEWGL